MEIKQPIYRMKRVLAHCVCLLFFIAATALNSRAQVPIKTYTVKNGRMYIALGKQLSEESLDSFITKYELYDLPIKQFLKNNLPDSLKKLGWNVDVSNKEMVIISKPLMSFEDLNNPEDKIILTEKNQSFAGRFPVVSSNVMYGYNRFRNKSPFSTNDSLITFFLRNNSKAKKVILSGSFSDWSTDALPMMKVDSGWILPIKLAPGKYWYKFIIDDNWQTDKDNLLSENDGLGNVNSVVYKTNHVFKLNSFTNAKRVYLAGSFNNWDPRQLQMNKTATGWELPLYLADGTHSYRFVVDGKWYEDADNPEKLPNEYGEFNSVVRLGKPYLFKLDGYTNAKKVALSGTFNGWRKDELHMTKTATGWELPYTLGAGNYEYVFVIDGKQEVKAANGKGNLTFIISPNYTFRLKGYENAKTVFLAGDFNNWSTDSYAMKKEGDEWVFTVHLFPGKHLYKFIVDGKWIIDPANKLWEQNEQETGNSVIWWGNVQ